MYRFERNIRSCFLFSQFSDDTKRVLRVPTAPGKPGKMVTVFPAWKNPGILSFLPNILEK